MENKRIKLSFKGLLCSHKWEIHAEKKTNFPSLIILKENGMVERIVDQTNTTIQIMICEKCGSIIKLVF